MHGLVAVKASKVPQRAARTASTTRRRTTASSVGEVSKASPEAVARWDGKLRDQIKKALGARKRPSFYSKKLRMRVTVTSVASSGGLWVTATAGMQLGVTWSRLSLGDKKSLAVASTLGEREGNAIAAFYLLALGKSQDAASYLRRAGDAAAEVRKAFE
jgi:hypothetical protein